MAKYDVPKRPTIKRKYHVGERKLFTIRLPSDLLRRLEADCKYKGYTKTELVEIVLDQYLQQQD